MNYKKIDNKIVKISVAMATYNGHSFIEKQIRSICEQTLKPNEIVFSDDQSLDGTISIIEKLSTEYSDIEFKIINNKERLGFAKNFLNAVINTSGDLIFLSDQDDIWINNKIETMVNAIIGTDYDLVFSNLRYIGSDDEAIDKKYVFNSSFLFNVKSKFFEKFQYRYCDLYKNLNIAGMSFAFNKSIKDKIISLISDKSLYDSIVYHDVLLSCLAINNVPVLYINKELTLYRLHTDNTIGDKQFGNNSKFDRYEWIKNLFNNQKFALEIEKICDGAHIDYIKKCIETTKLRLENFKSFGLVNCLKLLYNIRYINSFRSLVGDLVYIFKNEH